MEYGVLGTGNVARAIGDKLIEPSHSAMPGSGTAGNPQAYRHGNGRSLGTASCYIALSHASESG